MVQIDMTQPDRELTPGVDLWEIMECKEDKSRSGDKMLRMKFFRVRAPSDHMYDNIMLAGGGWGIGKAKLSTLVASDFKGDLDPLDLVGKRVWISTGVETYQGKDRLKVMIDDLACKGYQPGEVAPDGCEAPAEPDDDSEIPF